MFSFFQFCTFFWTQRRRKIIKLAFPPFSLWSQILVDYQGSNFCFEEALLSLLFILSSLFFFVSNSFSSIVHSTDDNVHWHWQYKRHGTKISRNFISKCQQLHTRIVDGNLEQLTFLYLCTFFLEDLQIALFPSTYSTIVIAASRPILATSEVNNEVGITHNWD